jgi:2-oxoglutarate dehydrogenase E2 component (dihydrolipoamide succinyltransferase)
MSFELAVPALGESITEVQIGSWLKQEGQPIRKDENLVLLESEKATVELPSPADGVLATILKQTGEVARVGEVIARIEPGQGAPSAAERKASSPQDRQKAVVMPAAQRVLAEAGVAPETVSGTGRGGRITKEDARRAVSKGAAPPAPAPAGADDQSRPVPAPIARTSVSAPGRDRDEELVPMSPLRRTVARRLVEAQSTMALLTTFNEIDMSATMALRKQFQEIFTARHGIKLGFMSFFIKATIEALKETPALNAEIRDQSIAYRNYYDIGVAIGGGKGLVVPVIRGAERFSFAEIEKTIADLAVRARDARLKPEELEGGTFTITNGGIYGSLLSTPIINPPQSGILGMHAIQERPVVVEGQIVPRPMMYVALTYDHRIVDGREAVTFLKRIKEIIENPARMLLEA